MTWVAVAMFLEVLSSIIDGVQRSLNSLLRWLDKRARGGPL